MKTASISLTLLCLFFALSAPAQKRVETGTVKTGASTHNRTTSKESKDQSKDRNKQSEPPPQVPITRPVDLIWPPVMIGPAAVPPAPPLAVLLPPRQDEQEVQYRQRSREIVDVTLSDCVQGAKAAGYNFAEQRIVSCEDSIVDMYLSAGEDGKYYFLVPEDTEIKDIGPHASIRQIRLIKPTDWSADHGVPLTAGHVYVVWTHYGDLLLVKANSLYDRHVALEWNWHSNLSHKEAERFLRQHEVSSPPKPYFEK